MEPFERLNRIGNNVQQRCIFTCTANKTWTKCHLLPPSRSALVFSCVVMRRTNKSRLITFCITRDCFSWKKGKKKKKKESKWKINAPRNAASLYSPQKKKGEKDTVSLMRISKHSARLCSTRTRRKIIRERERRCTPIAINFRLTNNVRKIRLLCTFVNIIATARRRD